ncbi:MAG: hypothetical protein LUC93_05380 [Planctomycetaceae bacterium]|nr:hypothetical protein [Planctomycetaceae bacterium]
MKRFATLALCFAVMALSQREGIAYAANADPYCPPGSLFCPTPSDTTAVADGSFGLGTYGSPSGNTGSYFESQLNEGEQLLMVAPGGDYANVPAPGTVPMAIAQAPMPAPVPAPDARPVTGSPIYSPLNTGYSAPVDGLNGFIPPPPGAPRPAVEPASYAQAPATYAQPPVMAPVSAPMPAPAPMVHAQPPMQMAQGGQQSYGYPQTAQAPGPVTDAAFGSYDSQNSYASSAREPQMGFAARQPEPAVVERDPYGVVTRSDFTGTPERSHPYQNTSTKKRRADKLSEVATETSQKKGLGNVDLKPRPENRLPWWKGGFWRNDDDDDAQEKKTRAERKAEKKQAKLAAKEAKLAARKDGDDRESKLSSLLSIF